MTSTMDHVLDASSPVTYGASVVTIISGMTVNEWGVVAGIVLGVATFAVNWWYRHKTWNHLRGNQDAR